MRRIVLFLPVTVIVLATIVAYSGLPALAQDELGDPQCGWYLYGQTGDGIGGAGAKQSNVVEGIPVYDNISQTNQISSGDSSSEVHQDGSGSIEQVNQSPGGDAWWEYWCWSSASGWEFVSWTWA